MVKNRCAWVSDDPIYIDYHDNEWGIAVYDDNKLFEMLVLELFQSGLSFLTILKKRENFREAFSNFDIKSVSSFDEQKIASLLQDAGIIRHRGKIAAAINNANCILEIQKKQSFSDFLWEYVGGKPIINYDYKNSTSPISDRLSKDLKKIGFKFVGSTTIYSFLQAAGFIDDHQTDCFRRNGV